MRLNKFKQFLMLTGVLGALAEGSISAAPMPGGLRLGDSFFDVFYDLTALDPAGSTPRDSFFDIFVDIDPGVPVSLSLIGHGHGLLLPDPGPTIPIELVSLELRGVGIRESPTSPSQPALIRESPTLQSMGHALVQEGNPPLMLNSFFDVFTEISLDGGSSWQPLGNRIVTIPDGGSTLLLSLIPATLCGWSLSRRRSVAA